MGTDGPSIDTEAERQEGKIGGVEETGDVMRDAPEVESKRWRVRMELKSLIKTEEPQKLNKKSRE